VSTGTIGAGSYDDRDLFGGGNLVGLPFTNVMTTQVPTPPIPILVGYLYTSVQGPTTDTFSVNGFSYTMTGTDGVGLNELFDTNEDRRAGGLDGVGPGGPYEVLRVVTGVNRSPSQWASDPAGKSIFSDSTVTGLASGTFYALPNSGPVTNLDLETTSIVSSFTTSPVDIPEPASWALLVVGFGAIGGGLRTARRRKGDCFHSV
jgi:hypothetical protein